MVIGERFCAEKVDRRSNGDVLVVESGAGRISALYDSNGDGTSSSTERA